MKKIKVFVHSTEVANCGVGWYRMISPLKQLEKQGLIELRVMYFNMGDKPVPNPAKVSIINNKITDIKYDVGFLDNVKWADVVYLCRDESTPFLAVNGGLKEYYKTKPFLVDIDDYVQFVRPHNPGYLSFHPNSAYNSLNLKLLNLADGLTVSTNYLKGAYKEQCKKIYVCPNSLDIEWRDKALKTKPAIPKKKNEIRIGWAGSAGHYENLKQIHRPIYNILKEYPNVTFHYTGLFGDLFRWPEFKGRVKTVKFASLKEWPAKLKSMGLDIALAPLADNHFNRAKSNLRVIEYWAAKYPTICSPVEPYKFGKDGKDVLFAMEEVEWYENMKRLIEDKNLRESLVDNGYKRLKKEFDVSKNCRLWYNVFKKFV